MLVFFFPFFENLGSYVYGSMRARTVLFLKGISAAIFSLRSCTACACPRARGRPRRLLLSCSRRQRRKVDKCRVADKKQTDRQTNTHYSFIGIDNYLPYGESSVKLSRYLRREIPCWPTSLLISCFKSLKPFSRPLFT